jgi:uncharacterized protein (DUF58 family)
MDQADLLYKVQEEVLERLGRVGIAARQAVESILSGQHRSIYRGLSVEFAGHRPYQIGDDPRHLDWMVYARTDRYSVRVYEEETHLRATIVLDCSGSMGYESARVSKLDYGRILAAALGFLMVRQGDSVGLALVDDKVRELHPPHSTMGYLLSLLERLEKTKAGGDTSLSAVLEKLAERLKRRGLVVLITDAFDDPAGIIQSLKHLRHRKQDVRVFQILDPAECEFPFVGMKQFVGLEGEASISFDADRVRGHYRQCLEEHCRLLAEGCCESGIPLQICRTDEDLAISLVKALSGPLTSKRRR